jgi:hypothetical protein
MQHSASASSHAAAGDAGYGSGYGVTTGTLLAVSAVGTIGYGGGRGVTTGTPIAASAVVIIISGRTVPRLMMPVLQQAQNECFCPLVEVGLHHKVIHHAGHEDLPGHEGWCHDVLVSDAGSGQRHKRGKVGEVGVMHQLHDEMYIGV